MLSKNQKKLIASMSQKKHRDQHGLFVAEGTKTVNDLMEAGMTPHLLAATREWNKPDVSPEIDIPPIFISREELSQISFLKTPKDVLALFHQSKTSLNNSAIKDQLTIVLDGIQDPGNLGTIVRLADWFGIYTIICSDDTADIYNPKVIQATMGSLARVNVVYTSLPSFLHQYKNETGNKVYGTYPNENNIYETPLAKAGIIILGNEGNGIRQQTSENVTDRITIPSFPANETTTESLNVGVATAIICAEFRRQDIYSDVNPME